MSQTLAADLETHLTMSDDEDLTQPRKSTRARKRTQAWSPGKVRVCLAPCRCAANAQGAGTHCTIRYCSVQHRPAGRSSYVTIKQRRLQVFSLPPLSIHTPDGCMQGMPALACALLGRTMNFSYQSTFYILGTT